MQAVAQVEEILVVAVDEVQELFGKQLRPRAQFRAQVFERLVAVS